uniref:Uncharacterized protein n=1 Tax=Gadus morhua TaxID=8049 RepID=A0A8C5BBT2_GADMO
MSTAATLPGPVSRSNTEEISVSNYCQVPFSAHSARTLIKSSPRFGTMSHHSFFSRHNPHPNRVTHIQGLNGNLVCTVRDDWGVTTSLFPHPLIKSQTGFRACPLPLGPLSPYGSCSHQSIPGLLPEAWREELKELAVKVNLASRAKNTLKPPMDEPARRKTQYSARTGRIIPPSAQAYQRRTSTQRQAHHAQPLYDQELLVAASTSPIQPLSPPPPHPSNPCLHLHLTYPTPVSTSTSPIQPLSPPPPHLPNPCLHPHLTHPTPTSPTLPLPPPQLHNTYLDLTYPHLTYLHLTYCTQHLPPPHLPNTSATST